MSIDEKNDMKETPGLDEIIGSSKSMKLVFQRIKQAAANSINVLIVGESGTGKDLIAQAIHRYSEGANKPFIPINMGAMARELVSSELFGHQKGAFTGATETKIGKFEQASGGTIFLDEISTMEEATQISLLRILETARYQRIGGKRFLKSDARIIAASNENLSELEDISDSNLREDLFHRLSVFTIEAPLLRNRGADVQLLASHFLRQASVEFDKKVEGFSDSVLNIFQAYSWPGNVRELKNIVQRAVVICRGKYVHLEHLPDRIKSTSAISTTMEIPIGVPLKEVEKAVIQQTLALVNGNKKRAAEIMGISRRALYNKITEYQIK
jgi:DNA-binding NtrC family response regulator